MLVFYRQPLVMRLATVGLSLYYFPDSTGYPPATVAEWLKSNVKELVVRCFNVCVLFVKAFVSAAGLRKAMFDCGYSLTDAF